jgi:hypothetical protein
MGEDDGEDLPEIEGGIITSVYNGFCHSCCAVCVDCLVEILVNCREWVDRCATYDRDSWVAGGVSLCFGLHSQ